MPHQPQKKASPVATPAAPAPSGVSRADQDLLARAVRKVMAREELSRREREVLNRHEKEQEEKRRWQYYGSISQKHWKEMSGRQAKVINEQAARYGIPFGGPTISLPAVVRALHDFLAENALKLAKEDDPLLQGGGNSPALERYREERASLAKLDRLEREGELIPRREGREALAQVATLIRGAGDALSRQFSPQAAEILHEALDDSRRVIDQTFGGTDADGDGETSNTD